MLFSKHSKSKFRMCYVITPQAKAEARKVIDELEEASRRVLSPRRRPRHHRAGAEQGEQSTNNNAKPPPTSPRSRAVMLALMSLQHHRSAK